MPQWGRSSSATAARRAQSRLGRHPRRRQGTAEIRDPRSRSGRRHRKRRAVVEQGDVPDNPDHVVPIGQAAIRRPTAGAGVALGRWGTTVPRDEHAAASLRRRHPRRSDRLGTLSPLEGKGILTSVAKTGRPVVVQHATGPCSVGSEVVRLVATAGFRQPSDVVRAHAEPESRP